ncbi:hypothetical protein NLW38_005478, partial [Klebsiella pneumoniae]
KKTDIIMIHNHPTWVIKSMIYRLGILSISLLTVGCVSTSNVLELGRDTYTVSATADGFRDAASARQSAFKTGSEKCNSLGKKFLLTNENVANRGLTLSGTKTHVKQRFLPLTPLLMVSDVLWSPVLPA